MKDENKRPTPTPLAPLIKGVTEKEKKTSASHNSLPDKGGLGVGSLRSKQSECLTPPLRRGGWEGFLPYNKTLTALARENRKNPTNAESKMWNELLRMRKFSKYKFLRQEPLAGYIVDFYCSELCLVIEIDGDSHAETIEYDEERTRTLNALGLTVVRYTNDDILRNIEGVCNNLLHMILMSVKKI